jgi:prephenate dehydrogenase
MKIAAVRVGIVGGRGAMGSWFKKFFKAHGCIVNIAGRNTVLTPKELAKRSDILIVSVPIDAAVGTIKEIAPHVSEGCMLADFTSLKEKTVAAMLKYSRKGVEVAGIHPMFGPTVRSVRGQAVLLVPGRGGKWFNWLKRMIKKGGGRVKELSAKDHDKLVAIVQALTHFSLISTSHALRELGVDVDESLQCSTPIYKINLALMGRVLGQDPKMYADIEMLNPHGRAAIKKYAEIVKSLQQTVEKGDATSFTREFDKTSSFLGAYKKKAMKQSDALIESL